MLRDLRFIKIIMKFIVLFWLVTWRTFWKCYTRDTPSVLLLYKIYGTPVPNVCKQNKIQSAQETRLRQKLIYHSETHWIFLFTKVSTCSSRAILNQWEARYSLRDAVSYSNASCPVRVKIEICWTSQWTSSTSHKIVERHREYCQKDFKCMLRYFEPTSFPYINSSIFGSAYRQGLEFIRVNKNLRS